MEDSLIWGANRAVEAHGGSFRTVAAHKSEIQTFVNDLRELGYGVQRWDNLSMRHVGKVVQSWQDRGLATATQKEYMTAVRIAARYYGNDRVACSKNSDLGVGRRVYIDNVDKSISAEQYQVAVDKLSASQDVRDQAVAVQLQLQRNLGLRTEESWKFVPQRDVMGDGRAYISAGTKGGRERMLPVEVASAEQARQTYEAVKRVQSQLANPRQTTIPPKMSEVQWRSYYYRAVRGVGLTKENGGTGHGNRHAWAQNRYQQLTGFAARVKFDSREEGM